MAASGKKNMFNEATRVQMPAMVHLTRLGYTYFGKITEDMAGTVYDPDTNILIDVFKEQFARLNPTHVGEAEQTLKTIRQELDNDDIGRSFYERLSSVSPVRLVDFENPQNNTYHFTAEFTCKRDQDEFRPDITLFVNGLEEQGKELEDILKKLDELQKKNTVLLRKYNGDAKFARVHKRIREENLARKAANKQPIVSEYDMSIMNVLLSIKSDIDQKVYDRNDILKKDAYFERTVMTQIKAGIDKLGIASAREDRVFIQSRITKQYLDQYNQTYSVA